MAFDFELSELALDRAYKKTQNIVDDVRASLQEGSDSIPESLILVTKREIDRIFDVDIKEEHVCKIVSELFYSPELEVELEKRIEHYNIVLHVVKTAHYLTDEKIKRTMKILEALDTDIPKELYIANYVRENYQENQRRKALKDAVKTIFPSINNNIILNEIANKAL
ncbi:hypothetical protein [Sulfurovum sp.]|uniref:hypothetical protein n=1 Tax=Sulfurovum sp. TaxID=1969726 RepID=UPI0035639BC2